MTIIDGDSDELDGTDDETTTAVENAKALEVSGRVVVSSGNKTLEIDLFPVPGVNYWYLEQCFRNLGHSKSYKKLIQIIKDDNSLWDTELIKRIDNTIKKGRFSQELSLLIDKDFVVPDYIKNAILHIKNCKDIS